MDPLLSGFIVVFLLIFSLVILIAGIFTMYFGAGKSRKIGGALSVIGIIVGFLTYYLFKIGSIAPPGQKYIIPFLIAPAVYIIAAIIGAAVALLAFIGAIMKA